MSRRCQTHSGAAIINEAVHVTRPSSSAAPSSTSSPAPNSDESIWNGASSLLSVPSTCGDIGATWDITSESGPNGNINWLNCGINDSGGWRPQVVRIDQVVVQDLSKALADKNSPFLACSGYVDEFYKYGNEYGIPPIMLASFAMQESSCNPATVGGAGEQGLMQLTPDKCANAPGGNCKDIDFNIGAGAKFLKSLLDENGGNVIPAIGHYNGWDEGMTYSSATAAAKTGCCRCQNNLDYLHQFLNGWCQNVNAYQYNLGIYHNLAACPYG
ncbi:lysozyme-like protein [Gymnopus androsaceus JB14]|uniref:Lysozyme-like protein n=1 Tax=Gymnopus androsaceus JB14 TaxID=1447944 RepID=A0A6A4IL78_9AGAR|nr:lysozyme-like protein [Gymnopus androsaceus JB14]